MCLPPVLVAAEKEEAKAAEVMHTKGEQAEQVRQGEGAWAGRDGVSG